LIDFLLIKNKRLKIKAALLRCGNCLTGRPAAQSADNVGHCQSEVEECTAQITKKRKIMDDQPLDNEVVFSGRPQVKRRGDLLGVLSARDHSTLVGRAAGKDQDVARCQI
jgi:hypothetical protein